MVNAGASSGWLKGKAKTPAGTDETPQTASDEEAHRLPAESNSGRASRIMYPDCSSLNWIPVVMFQPLYLTSS